MFRQQVFVYLHLLTPTSIATITSHTTASQPDSHTHRQTDSMESLYEGKSNHMLTEAESDEAVRLYLHLSASMSMNARHELVAAQMTYATRIVTRWQVRRAMERYEESGGATAMIKRHVNRKLRQIAPAKRRKSRRAMPLSTKNAVVEWALAVCTLTAGQIRDELYSDHYGLWASSTISQVRLDAGLTRKRTTPGKREACPVQQHMHAEQLVNLGYLPEHFIFIGAHPAAAARHGNSLISLAGWLALCLRRNAQGCEGLVLTVWI